MNEWIPKRGYRGKKNADLFERLLRACEAHDITWQWVRGHNGDRFNELADRAATARIFDGARCEGCNRELESEYLDFNWQSREIICGHCGEEFPMEDVNG